MNLDQAMRIAELNRRSGPNEDDCELMCPWIDLLPEESEHEEGSPLDFRERGSAGHHSPRGWNVHSTFRLARWAHADD